MEAISSNGEGTLTVVHEDSADKFTVVENATAQRGARTMALDTKTHNVFLATAQYGPSSAPTPERPNPRPAIVPGSFMIFGVREVRIDSLNWPTNDSTKLAALHLLLQPIQEL